MTKGRKITQEERVYIVTFRISHSMACVLTVETCQVSYRQINPWVRKYEANSVDDLIDHCGMAKLEHELTEAERL